jgi:hypothetical protein
MSVAFDAASGSAAGNVAELSWNHTPVGTPAVVYAAIFINNAAGTDPSSSATYGGQVMTKIGSKGIASAEILIIFRLVSPPAGLQTVAISWIGSWDCAGTAATFMGIDLSTPEGTIVTAASGGETSSSIDVTSAAGETVVDFLGQRAGTNGTYAATESGQTLRKEQSDAGDLHVCISDRAGQATTTMGWSWTGAGPRYHIAWPLKPAAAGRTTKNTRSHGLGMELGMDLWMPR